MTLINTDPLIDSFDFMTAVQQSRATKKRRRSE